MTYASVRMGGNERMTRGSMTEKGLRLLLDQCDWKKAEVARRVGVSRTAVWKAMEKWEIPP